MPFLPHFRPRAWSIVGTLILVTLFVRLGLWQLDRAALKQERHDLMAGASSAPPLTNAVGPKAPLAPNTARTCDLKANGSGVPAGATAVLVSVVATQTTGTSGGFLSVYRNGIAWPGTSNLNWSGPNQNVAVTTVTAVDASAICNLYASQVTNVVVDVLGYYR